MDLQDGRQCLDDEEEEPLELMNTRSINQIFAQSHIAGIQGSPVNDEQHHAGDLTSGRSNVVVNILSSATTIAASPDELLQSLSRITTSDIGSSAREQLFASEQLANSDNSLHQITQEHSTHDSPSAQSVVRDISSLDLQSIPPESRSRRMRGNQTLRQYFLAQDTASIEPELFALSAMRETISRSPVRRSSSPSRSTLGNATSTRTSDEELLEFLMERERSGLSEEEERAQRLGLYDPTLSRDASRWFLTDRNRVSDQWTRQEHGESLELSKSSCTVVEPGVENVMRYLRARLYGSRSEPCYNALINSLRMFTGKKDNFVLDLGQLRTLDAANWIQPGVEYAGHTYSAASFKLRHPLSGLAALQQQERVDFDKATSQCSVVDLKHWPVSMTIESISWEHKTLQGTMRTYDVPQLDDQHDTRFTAGTIEQPIISHVEGQIIDLKTQTFLSTPSTVEESNTATINTRDALNWRRLPPFREMTDTAVANMLLTVENIDKLSEEYIFMRWKEMFYTSSGDLDQGVQYLNERDMHGVYYISMKRDTGYIEGQYYNAALDSAMKQDRVLILQGISQCLPAICPR